VLHALSPLRPRLPAHGLSLVQQTLISHGKSVSELPRQIVVSTLFLTMSGSTSNAFHVWTALNLVEASTGFEVAVAYGVLWRWIL
jgi:hypothetical protein